MIFGYKLSLTLAVTMMLSMSGLAQAQDKTLVVYAGRSKTLVEPLVEKFEKETGVKVQVRYAGTTQLALALLQEGSRSPADVFWAQDTGALELLTEKGLFAKLPDDLAQRVAEPFRSADQTWLATSARGRTLAYSSTRLKAGDLPKSIFELTDPKWKGRIGWAPTNASFQAFVTGLRSKIGEERTRAWLQGVHANEPKVYPRNGPILNGIAAGEIDLGLLNHYYLVRTKSQQPDFPVEQTTFATQGDMGNLLFVAGAGVLKSSAKADLARQFIAFLVSDASQEFFTTQVFEYPVTPTVKADNDRLKVQDARDAAPNVPYSDLKDLDGTLKLLRELGLI